MIHGITCPCSAARRKSEKVSSTLRDRSEAHGFLQLSQIGQQRRALRGGHDTAIDDEAV